MTTKYLISMVVTTILATIPIQSLAKLKVVTTTTTLASLVTEIGGERVHVTSLTRGPQDPHFVEAKPSYMVDARGADLLISVGLELEVGWLPNILRGSKNPKIQAGGVGFLEAATFIQPIEMLKGKVDRSQGDVHALGNPHYHLDPERAVQVIEGIAQKLADLDPSSAAFFRERAAKKKTTLQEKIKTWRVRIDKLQVTGVVSYHRTLNYFFSRFGLKFIDAIEPRPGVPPSARHIIQLINKVKELPRVCILVESFFETSEAKRIQKETGVFVTKVPTEVKAMSGAENYTDLVEQLVVSLEQCAEGKRHE